MKQNLQSLKLIGLFAVTLGVGLILVTSWRTTASLSNGQVWQVAEDHARVLASVLGSQIESLGTNATPLSRSEVFSQLRWDGQICAAVLLQAGEGADSSAGMILVSRDPAMQSGSYETSGLARMIPPELLQGARSSHRNESIRHDHYVACVQPVLLTASPSVATPGDYGSLLLIFDISSSLARAKGGFWVLALTVSGLALLASITVYRVVFVRLARLNAAARKIAGGNFSTETRLPGQDEIAQLSNSLNQVAAWVENSTSALRESERSYRELVESSNDLIWSADPDGRWTFVNRGAASKIYGCKVEEMLGRKISSFATDETETDNVITFEQIDKGQNHIQADTIHERKDGTPVFLSFNGFVHRDASGQIAGMSGIARDTTARRQAEEQVREQASLIDLAGDAIFVRNLEDRVLFWNRSCEVLFGWTNEEAIGKQSTQLAFRDLKAVGDAQMIVLNRGEWTGELRPLRKDGREIIVNSRWTLVKDSQGAPKSMLCINTDITEKKHLEAQFLRVQRLEGIGTLASGIAHDLNNVFSPITISLALLKDKITDPAANKMLSVLGTSTKRGADIVKQLLTFARGTEGKMGLLQPTHIVKELINIINGTFSKTIQLKYNLPKNLWPVIGDATRLHQVLLNLSINARDAMGDGGQLSILAANVELDGHFARLQPEAKPGPYVVIEITDTGTGIPQENLQRIFDPFFTTKEPGKGTGLGLSSALGIVRSHGGFITVKTMKNVGTTFKIHLPAQPAEEGQAVDRPAAPLPRGHGETILIVEDEEIIRLATVATLERYGYRALEAQNGIEGRALFLERQSDISLVLTDLMMPKQDGVLFIRDLREVSLVVPVIVSTGMDAEVAAESISQYDIAAILEKPYTGDQMIRVIHRTIADRSEVTDRSPATS